MRFVMHCFMPGHTIDAVLKLKNRHDLPLEQLLVLRAAFNELNGGVVVRPGQACRIPVLFEPPLPGAVDHEGGID